IQSSFTPEMIQDFNLGGAENFWDHLLANQIGQIRTWAIFWYASIFLQKALCLHPSLSYSRNIGWDGTGAHCQYSKVFMTQPINYRPITRFPDSLIEDQQIYRDIQTFYQENRSSGFKSVIRKLWKLSAR
ncbi:MAG: sugar transferase, partial [Fidelibacterota bacterium]